MSEPTSVPMVLGPDAVALAVRQAERIFLDTNVWIDITEGRTDEARVCRSRLTEAVKAGHVVCPVAAPIVWELYLQESDSAARVASCMDELSLGVSFASNEDVFQAEVDAFAEGLLSECAPASIWSEVLVPVASYLLSRSFLEFPAGCTLENRARLVEFFKGELKRLSVSGLIGMKARNLPEAKAEVRGIQAAVMRRQAESRGDRRNAWFIEARALAESDVLPRLRDFGIRAGPLRHLLLVARSSGLRADRKGRRLEELFERLPALRNRVNAMTVSGFDVRRRDSFNDLIDVELLCVPLAYSNAFVSGDRWIRALLSPRYGMLKGSGTVFLAGLHELGEYLRRYERASE